MMRMIPQEACISAKFPIFPSFGGGSLRRLDRKVRDGGGGTRVRILHLGLRILHSISALGCRMVCGAAFR